MALIQITDLTFAYPGSFDPVFEHVSFQLDTDWRLGLTGRNGRGKTTLLRLLQGQYPHQGTITAPGGFEYFPYPIPDAALTPLELLECSFPDVPQWRLRRELAPLFVTDDALYRPFSTLSGGEQAKILLALLFAREGRYLLIDEPTNHLDETGRALVSRYLAKKSGFLLVSHDRAFLDGCVDHILSINRGGIEVQKGNFSSWYENRQRQDAFELAQNAQLKKEIGRLKQAARQSRAWADKVENTKIGPHSAKVTGEADAMGGRAYIGEQSRRMQQRRKNLERRQNAAIEEKSALLKNIEQAAPLKLHQLPYHTDRLALLRDVSVCYGGAPVCRGVSFCVEQGDRIALRGANGTGKTSLLRALERKGAYVLDCDAVYHEMLKDDEPLLRALREAFGDVIFRQDGSVNIHAIGLIVFKDRKKLAELDAIVHEHIPRALAQKMAATNAEIIGLDAIKLIESGLGAICDATVAVTAPEEVRVKRIMARDSITEDYARSRVAAQQSAEYFRARCDYEFVNDLPTAAAAENAAEVYIHTIINTLKEETER